MQSGKETDTEGSEWLTCLQELSKTWDPLPPQERGTAIQLLLAMQMLPVPTEVPVAASRCSKCLAPVQRRRLLLNTRSRSEESCFSKTGAPLVLLGIET